MRRTLKFLVNSRLIILSVLGVALYLTISTYHISLWYILVAGALLGVLFERYFADGFVQWV